jgi:hypothetical protein
MAYSVGMKITDSMARQLLAPEIASGHPDTEHAGAEHAPIAISMADGTPFDEKVVEALVAAVDARIHELDGKVERRIRDGEARIAVDLQALDHRHLLLAGGAQAVAESLDGRIQQVEESTALVRSYVDEKIAEQIGMLRTQVVLLNQEFAGAVATIVREEVARQVEARAAALERSLQEQVLLLMEAAAGQPRPSDAPPVAAVLVDWAEAEGPLPLLPIDGPRAEAPETVSEAAGLVSTPRRANGSRKRRGPASATASNPAENPG